MALEIRQNATSAPPARSHTSASKRKANSGAANTRRFFGHCRGRQAASNACTAPGRSLPINLHPKQACSRIYNGCLGIASLPSVIGAILRLQAPEAGLFRNTRGKVAKAHPFAFAAWDWGSLRPPPGTFCSPPPPPCRAGGPGAQLKLSRP